MGLSLDSGTWMECGVAGWVRHVERVTQPKLTIFWRTFVSEGVDDIGVANRFALLYLNLAVVVTICT